MLNKNLKIFIIGLLTGALLLYLIKKPDIEYVEVPVTVEVPIPVIEKEYDTIKVPTPYKVLVNSPVNKALSDSLAKAYTVIDSLKTYKDFTIKRKYTQIFDDSTQTITVFAETTGTLDALHARYKTKPSTIKLDTILTIPIPKYNEFYGGLSVGLPIDRNPEFGVTPIFKADLYFKTKKDRLWSISVDSREYVFVGHAWKF